MIELELSYLWVIGKDKADLLFHRNTAHLFGDSSWCEADCSSSILSILHHLPHPSSQELVKSF